MPGVLEFMGILGEIFSCGRLYDLGRGTVRDITDAVTSAFLNTLPLNDHHRTQALMGFMAAVLTGARDGEQDPSVCDDVVNMLLRIGSSVSATPDTILPELVVSELVVSRARNPLAVRYLTRLASHSADLAGSVAEELALRFKDCVSVSEVRDHLQLVKSMGESASPIYLCAVVAMIDTFLHSPDASSSQTATSIFGLYCQSDPLAIHVLMSTRPDIVDDFTSILRSSNGRALLPYIGRIVFNLSSLTKVTIVASMDNLYILLINDWLLHQDAVTRSAAATSILRGVHDALHNETDEHLRDDGMQDLLRAVSERVMDKDARVRSTVMYGVLNIMGIGVQSSTSAFLIQCLFRSLDLRSLPVLLEFDRAIRQTFFEHSPVATTDDLLFFFIEATMPCAIATKTLTTYLQQKNAARRIVRFVAESVGSAKDGGEYEQVIRLLLSFYSRMHGCDGKVAAKAVGRFVKFELEVIEVLMIIFSPQSRNKAVCLQELSTEWEADPLMSRWMPLIELATNFLVSSDSIAHLVKKVGMGGREAQVASTALAMVATRCPEDVLEEGTVDWNSLLRTAVAADNELTRKALFNFLVKRPLNAGNSSDSGALITIVVEQVLLSLTDVSTIRKAVHSILNENAEAATEALSRWLSSRSDDTVTDNVSLAVMKWVSRNPSAACDIDQLANDIARRYLAAIRSGCTLEAPVVKLLSIHDIKWSTRVEWRVLTLNPGDTCYGLLASMGYYDSPPNEVTVHVVRLFNLLSPSGPASTDAVTKVQSKINKLLHDSSTNVLFFAGARIDFIPLYVVITALAGNPLEQPFSFLSRSGTLNPSHKKMIEFITCWVVYLTSALTPFSSLTTTTVFRSLVKGLLTACATRDMKAGVAATLSATVRALKACVPVTSVCDQTTLLACYELLSNAVETEFPDIVKMTIAKDARVAIPASLFQAPPELSGGGHDEEDGVPIVLKRRRVNKE